MGDIIKVTLYKEFEIPVEKVKYRGRNNYSEAQLDIGLIQNQLAEEIARDIFTEECTIDSSNFKAKCN